VLVIDDEPDLLEVTRFVLESEGFGVETAASGEEGLKLLRVGRRPGVVLLDLMMPGMGGWKFLDEVSKSPALKGIPVVVLTAGGPVGVNGAVEVLRKPFDLAALVETVERRCGGG
jgi:CheY-like chemotaxis protein